MANVEVSIHAPQERVEGIGIPGAVDEGTVGAFVKMRGRAIRSPLQPGIRPCCHQHAYEEGLRGATHQDRLSLPTNPLRFPISIEFQELLQPGVGPRQNHVERLEPFGSAVTIPSLRIHREDLMGIVEKEISPVAVAEFRPTCIGEESINLARCCRFSMILWLGDCRRHHAVRPQDEGLQPDLVVKDLVVGNPAGEILHQSRLYRFDYLSDPPVGRSERNDAGRNAKGRWNGDFGEPTGVWVEIYQMLRADENISGLTKIFPIPIGFN
jgi:hypothetical protein